MTIRFAAAWGGTTPVLSRSLCLGAPLGASNDNPLSARRLALHAVPSAPEAELDAGLAAALMHFARHGLSAATQARDEALAAHASGDVEASVHWLDICRRLDRRMARAAERRLGA
ncbi:hypothetical protein [Novosphingobium sp. AP12]|uniref:hypothetical protein n=1 Tax=Novosphingobium sp. AP12 TaxID=1144305 RepID=UPI0002720AC5|nr:hypothetical protein [Novosphingobium sp. AP12]EJL28574.1 hypothetical protein PMI02_02582 [Novosphingobium sp. AP12]